MKRVSFLDLIYRPAIDFVTCETAEPIARVDLSSPSNNWKWKEEKERKFEEPR